MQSHLRKVLRLKADYRAGGRMPCPECGADKTTVNNTRPALIRETAIAVYRRRKCPNGHVWTSYELTEQDLEQLINEIAQERTKNALNFLRDSKRNKAA